MFGWLKNRRRERLIAAETPPHWRELFEARVPQYAHMPEAMRAVLEARARVLYEEKHFEGCGGFELTEEACVTVCGTAALLLLDNPADYFPLLRSVLLYPSGFWVSDEAEGEDGVVQVFGEERAGESWAQGVVVLAWDEVAESYRNLKDGYNVILHEFAHQLDFVDDSPGAGFGTYDESEYLSSRWGPVMQAHYDGFLKQLNRGKRTVLDEYGGEDPAEYFAVVVETFFESPKKIRSHYPKLYALLTELFGLDPLSW